MRQCFTAVPEGPSAIGPYSLAVAAEGKFLFVSGMTPMDPATGKMHDGPVGEQTRIVLENMRKVVEGAGAKLTDVVSCRVFLAQLTEKNFAEMNAVQDSPALEIPMTVPYARWWAASIST